MAMQSNHLVRITAACVLLGATVAQTGVAAQPTPAPVSGSVATAALPQPWAYQADWYCPANLGDQEFADGIRTQLNEHGARGWELVSFGPAPGPSRTCYFAVYKTPRR